VSGRVGSQGGLPTRPAAPVVLLALTALAAVLRFAYIAHQGFWFDEAVTSLLVHNPMGDMLSRIPSSESTPPVYYVLAWFWAHGFGYGEAGLRSLSAVIGIVTVPVAYWVGLRLISRRVGLILAALVACNPLLIWYSQEARAYALMVLLSAVSIGAALELRDEVRRNWVIAWAAAAALALATHYYAALVVIPEIVWLWLRHRSSRDVRLGVVAVLLTAAALAPLAIAQLPHFSKGGGWLTATPVATRAAQLPGTFAIGFGAPLGVWLELAMYAVAMAAVAVIAARGTGSERDAARAAGVLLLSGVAIVAALLVLGYDELNARNLLALWLPLALVIAVGLGSRAAGRWGVAGAAILMAVGVVTVLGIEHDATYQRPDWRPLAKALGPEPAGTTRAVFVVGGCQALPIALYVPGLSFPARTASASELDLIGVRRPYTWQTGCTGAGHALPRRFVGFTATGPVRRVGQFSIERLAAPHPTPIAWRFPPGERYLVGGLEGVLLVPAGSPRPAS
jgi:4-amino-4-deoxy-L-arabinose transferase-like glycosyltransferase